MLDNDLLSTISQLSGYLSLTIWLFAQLPQIIENYFNRSVDGVNVIFLSSWIAGDVANLTGCLLTKALPFQTLIASYYCFIDVVLSFQFYYYTKVYPYHKTPHNLLQSPNMVRRSLPDINDHSSLLRSDSGYLSNSNSRSLFPSSRKSSFLSKLTKSGILATSVKRAGALPISPMDASESDSGVIKGSYLALLHKLSPILLLKISNDDIGKIVAWLCTSLYLSARIPQIITNYRKRSTSGISPYLFLFAMLGNSFYTISIVSDLTILYNNDGDALHRFWDQLPFLIGSGGTVFFDLIILSQCRYYGKGRQPRSQRSADRLQRNHGRSHSRNMSTDHDGFQKPDWYNNSFQYEEDDEESNNNSTFIESPPPHHYISGSYPNVNGPQRSGNGSAPMSSMPSFSFARPKSIHKSARSSSSSIHSPMNTNLIPSIINSYSSVSKKMEVGDKTPFSPSDFLNDEFHTPVENSSFSLSNN